MPRLRPPVPLRAALTIRGLTQEDLSRRTGIPQNSISRYCRGCVPDVLRARRIESVLGFTRQGIDWREGPRSRSSAGGARRHAPARDNPDTVQRRDDL
jgi:transcriptional regulator with XRE-family HTH domain